MSDLSLLNPTSHAIAVYASRALSSVATQHSLPSGRYPLTWAGLPLPDRTSLGLAHTNRRDPAGPSLERHRRQVVEQLAACHDRRPLREVGWGEGCARALAHACRQKSLNLSGASSV